MDLAGFVKLLLDAESLKRLPRSGWILAGVEAKDYETVASHSWGTSIVALLLAKSLREDGLIIDIEHVLTLAIIHDLPEALIADIPRQAVDHGGEHMLVGKADAERSAIKKLLSHIDEIGLSLIDAWSELEIKTSLESRIVLDADLLDMLIHAISLERSGVTPILVHDFFISSRERLADSGLDISKKVFNLLLEEHLHQLKQSGLVFEDIKPLL